MTSAKVKVKPNTSSLHVIPLVVEPDVSFIDDQDEVAIQDIATYVKKFIENKANRTDAKTAWTWVIDIKTTTPVKLAQIYVNRLMSQNKRWTGTVKSYATNPDHEWVREQAKKGHVIIGLPMYPRPLIEILQITLHLQTLSSSTKPVTPTSASASVDIA